MRSWGRSCGGSVASRSSCGVRDRAGYAPAHARHRLRRHAAGTHSRVGLLGWVVMVFGQGQGLVQVVSRHFVLPQLGVGEPEVPVAWMPVVGSGRCVEASNAARHTATWSWRCPRRSW
jgi:hypothetical protein